jgi:hypothetical protein
MVSDIIDQETVEAEKRVRARIAAETSRMMVDVTEGHSLSGWNPEIAVVISLPGEALPDGTN